MYQIIQPDLFMLDEEIEELERFGRHGRWLVIYAYTYLSYIKLALVEGFLRVKVGDTTQGLDLDLAPSECAKIRMRQQGTAAESEAKILVGAWLVDRNLINRDHDLHEIFKVEGRRSRAVFTGLGKEWFAFDPSVEAAKEQISSTINSKRGLGYRPHSYAPRNEQQEAIDRIYSHFSNGGNEFLLDGKPRLGKSFIFVKAVKKLGYKYAFILTYAPAAGRAFRDEIEKHVDFQDVKFYWAIGHRGPIEFDSNSKYKHHIVFASAQDYNQHRKAKESGKPGKIRYSLIDKHTPEIIGLDEVHLGMQTANAKATLEMLSGEAKDTDTGDIIMRQAREVLKAFKPDVKVLSLSGTPIKIRLNGLFSEENTYTFSYIDEQRCKNAAVAAGDTDSPYLSAPKLNFHAMQLSSKLTHILKDRDVFSDDEGLSMRKVFASEDGETFRNEQAVRCFADLLSAQNGVFAGDKFGKLSPYNTLIQHTYVFFDMVNSATAFQTLLKSHPAFSNFEIFCVAGNHTDVKDVDDLENQIKAAHRHGKRTITIGCGRWTAAVTIRPWDSIFMLHDEKSVERYIQASFRPQTPWEFAGVRKEEAHIFDYNPSRCFEMLYEYASYNGRNDGERAEFLRSFLEVANVLLHTENEIVTTDFEMLVRSVLEHTNCLSRFSSLRIVNIDVVDQELSELLIDSGASKAAFELDVAKQGIKQGKTFKQGKIKDGEDKEGKKVELTLVEIRELIRSLITRLPPFLMLSSHYSLEDIVREGDPQLFKQATNVDLTTLSLVISRGYIRTDLLDPSIRAFCMEVAD